MRNLTFLFFIAITFNNAYSQIDFKTNGMTLEEMLDNSSVIPKNFESILNLDVITYYDLEYEYDTELKVKYFKDTQEYKDKLEKLESLKSELEKNISFIKKDASILSDYNIQKQAFEISIGETFHNYPNENYPKTLDGIDFSILKIQEKRIELVQNMYDQFFLAKTTEQNALKIENNKGDVKIYMFFRPKSSKKITYDKLNDFVNGYGEITYRTVTETFIIPDFVRIVLCDENTKDVFYDNVYTQNSNYNLLTKDISRIDELERIKQQELLAQKNKQKQLQEQREKEKQLKAQKELNEFLSNRAEKQYNYKDVNSSDYQKIEQKIKNYLKDELNKDKQSTSFDLDIYITKNYQGAKNVKCEIKNTINTQLKQRIDQFSQLIELQPFYMFNDYTVNTYAQLSFNCSYNINECNVKISEDVPSSNKSCEVAINYIKKNNYPNGQYTTVTKTVSVNDYIDEKTEIKSFKGFGGSGYAFLSLIVPGTGDYFVNGGKGSMLGKNTPPIITTITAIGFVGSGVYFKTQSNKNYDLYHNATEQSDIDKYYDLANNQNKASYILLGTGAVIWLWDVIWTAKTGSGNKKINEYMKGELSFSPILFDNRNLGLSLTYNF
jgi:hypothetical protein